MTSATLGGTMRDASGPRLPPCREGRVSKVLPDRLEVAVRSLTGDVQTLAARGAAARAALVDDAPALVEPKRGDRVWVAEDEGAALVIIAWEPIAPITGVPITPPDGADRHVVVDLPVPATVHTISHNLGKYPHIDIYDTAGDLVETDVEHVSTSVAISTSLAAFAGQAICN